MSILTDLQLPKQNRADVGTKVGTTESVKHAVDKVMNNFTAMIRSAHRSVPLPL